MARYSRAVTAAMLLGMVSMLIASAASSSSLHERKWEAVKTALDKSGSTASLEAAVDNASALLSIAGDVEHPQALRISLSGSPEFNIASLEQGKVIVLDFSDTVCLDTLQNLQLKDTRIIKSVRSSIFKLEPRLVARVALELAVPAKPRIEEYPGQTRVYLDAKDKDATSWVDISFGEDGLQPIAEDEAAEVERLIAQLSTIKGAQITVPAQEVAAQAQEKQLLDSLLALREAPVTVQLPEREDPEVHALDQSLRAVAAVDLSLNSLMAGVDAVQEEEGRAFDRVSGDTDPPVVADPEPVEDDRPAVAPEADEPAPEIVEAEEAPDNVEELEEGAEDSTADEGAEDTQEGVEGQEEGVEPPMPRSSAGPETMEANRAIVTRMQELLETAQPSDSITPMAGEPTAVTAEGEPTVIRAASANGDPLARRVNIDFREMELVNVVAILANTAGINIIAGTDLQGTVTAALQGVTLRQAIDTVLRQNGLGLIEEEDIYRIVPYEEALEAQRETRIIELENAKASEIETVLTDMMRGSAAQRLVNVSSNESANMVVISGPASRIDELAEVARNLDVAEPVLPTITEAIKLNYAEPADAANIIEGMLTEGIGSVAADERGRFIIVQDVPVVVEQVRMLVTEIDRPMKQVLIDTMVVDVALQDNADTGVNWLLEAVQDQSRRQAAIGPTAPNIGNLQELGLGTNMNFSPNPASALTFGILSGDINWSGVISAEIRNQNGRLVSNPVLVAVENTVAKISISQEIPYVELRETGAGGSQTSTEFKEVGTILQVTPTVTHDDHILVKIAGKESNTAGEFNGIPIEDKREVETSLRIANQQTIFIGGLRKNSNNATVRKVPVLGNIPVVNFLFRSNQRTEQVNELLIFLTCSVLEEDTPALTGYQRAKFETGKSQEVEVNAENSMYHDMIYPGEMRDPVWKWRRP